MLKKKIVLPFLLSGFLSISAQVKITDGVPAVNDTVVSWAKVRGGDQMKIKVQSVWVNVKKKSVEIRINDEILQLPIRLDQLSILRESIRSTLPNIYRPYSIRITVEGGTPIEEFLLHDAESSRLHKRRALPILSSDKPWVRKLGQPYNISKGLSGRHIALWGSHGLYFDQLNERWRFQRAPLFGTVEDLFTSGFVLPYLAPMLENAGANVIMPRERDINSQEYIVDNDSNSDSFIVNEGEGRWSKILSGGYERMDQQVWVYGESPFRQGSYLKIQTTNSEEVSEVQWIPEISKKGIYAVYVTYPTDLHSVTDARYSVFHAGGETQFLVNQRMGGGTWVYLGSFEFEKGKSPQMSVILTNKSKSNGVVTADAIRIGGGMGCVARNIGDVDFSKSEVSGMPKFVEGSRYWLQMAGVPDSIYSVSKGTDDYKDDYVSRPMWVNYLAGGSRMNPKQEGLNVPVDLALAVHSDAGVTRKDSIIGTLGIYSSKKGKFDNGTSSLLSRDLTDYVQTSIVSDVRHDLEPLWSRRAMWNKEYAEARIPQVPTMLLELLSHQNLYDMRMGLDPHFRFVVSRAIYKGVVRYLSAVSNQNMVIQPLPVDSMKAEFIAGENIRLSWRPTLDPNEVSAISKGYLVYVKEGNKGFSAPRLIKDTVAEIPIDRDVIYQFKVTAVNEGGESFPSQILSASRVTNEKGIALIVDGFSRLSAPSYEADTLKGGFLRRVDAGVPYQSDFSYIGEQYEMDRMKEWESDDSPGFGACYLNRVGHIIKGNSFDNSIFHGRAFVDCGYSFVSCTERVIHQIDLQPYTWVDLLYGKQKTTTVGQRTYYSVLPFTVREALRKYVGKDHHIMISGAFVGQDIVAQKNDSIMKFMDQIFRVKYITSNASLEGELVGATNGWRDLGTTSLGVDGDEEFYGLESVDSFEPTRRGKGRIILRYRDGGKSAAVLTNDQYLSCVFGFPFESISDPAKRSQILQLVLNH